MVILIVFLMGGNPWIPWYDSVVSFGYIEIFISNSLFLWTMVLLHVPFNHISIIVRNLSMMKNYSIFRQFDWKIIWLLILSHLWILVRVNALRNHMKYLRRYIYIYIYIWSWFLDYSSINGRISLHLHKGSVIRIFACNTFSLKIWESSKTLWFFMEVVHFYFISWIGTWRIFNIQYGYIMLFCF